MGFAEQKPIVKQDTVSPLSNGKMTLESDTVTRLSAWDQASMRGFMRVTLCFPFDNNALPEAKKHLEESLARLALQRPDFAGRLETHAGGIVHLRTKAAHAASKPIIPFSIIDISSDFPYKSYTELKEAEFPPGAFVHPQFAQPCEMAEDKPGVPVSVVKAFVIPGGLFLGIFFNHAIADGDCLRIFLNSFSGQTCHRVIEGAAIKQLTIPNAFTGANQKELLERIPEYVVLDKFTGPTMPRMRAGGVPMEDITKVGKIFVFSNERLKVLRTSLAEAAGRAGKTTKVNGKQSCCGEKSNEEINNSNANKSDTKKSPVLYSNYTCMAALTWAHLARSRQQDSTQYLPREPGVDDLALLQTMVNWKWRAFQAANENYFGNSTAVAATRIPTDGLLAEAAHDITRLAELVEQIEKTITGVDEAYVCARTEFFNTIADPRFIGLRFDPRTPQDLGFNTWRHFGADTEWSIPGVGEKVVVEDYEDSTKSSVHWTPTTPEMMRRLQDAWNMSGALILPARSTSEVHELLVTLPKTSMDLLCEDREWMEWVDHVIG